MASDRVVNSKGLYGWIDKRFPLTPLLKNHLAEYYAPKNFNFWYFFGSLATVILVLQIVTGILLVMHYKPDASLNSAGIPVAFASVEYIMREVPFGWLIRYMHSTGASAFFVVIYLHMFRGLIYGSYREPRELVWIFGCLIFLSLMAEAFFGYLLPWGQMSFWGAQVIVNLFAAVPLIGPDLAVWIRGDFVVGDATLNRFFAFHVIAIPFVIAGLVAAHIIALHEVGSNNPDGVEIKKQKGTGTARAGSIKNPLFRGGGTVFGPRTRDYGIKLNKNVKRLARKSALSIKLKAKSISVIESLNFKNPKTKSFIDVLSAIGLDTKKTLFVTNGLNKNVYLSARNLNKSEVITDSEISTYKIMNAQHLVIEENVIEKIESNLG